MYLHLHLLIHLYPYTYTLILIPLYLLTHLCTSIPLHPYIHTPPLHPYTHTHLTPYPYTHTFTPLHPSLYTPPLHPYIHTPPHPIHTPLPLIIIFYVLKPMVYEIYRQSLIGKALQDTVDDKVKKGEFTPLQAKIVLGYFDSSIPTVFNRSVQTNVNFKGYILSYNYVEGVWRFSTTDLLMTVNNEFIRADQVTIVACDADTSVDTGRKRRKKSEAA